MKFSSFRTLALIGLLGLALTACEEDKNTPSNEEGALNMMFEYAVDGMPFDTATVYTIGGTAVKFSVANFYVGGIQFMPEEGDMLDVAGKYLLVTPESGMQEVASVKTGHYHMARFFVGVDSITNSQTEEDFTSRDAADPLAVQFPAMHWNWNSGYRFLRVDGKVDTDGDGMVDETMAFHLGTNPMLQNLEYTVHKDVETGSNMLHFEFDLARLFNGIDLSTDYVTHTGNNPELAAAVRDNISSAIAVKH